jgi:D-3-phosphoglycerate dehydrogenase / 2-oxoglutarate reductase
MKPVTLLIGCHVGRRSFETGFCVLPLIAQDTTTPSRHFNLMFSVLLLEGVHPGAVGILEKAGCTVEYISKALPKEELIKKVATIHILGIRSKTNVDAEVLDAAKNLLAIGCFCIGTNQVDLVYANSKAVAVFNSPFANTRSVAELVIGEIICLSRKLTLRSHEVHNGIWNKSMTGCYEVRGKTLGIVGYGHIGSQVGVLAEGLGMRVVFHDHVPKLSLGNTKQLENLEAVLQASNFVTLHVPETPETMGMIGEKEIAVMQRGSYLMNLSRGTVVDLEAVASALKSGHLGGTAVDVYPVEPESAGEKHTTPLQGLDNTILTPHIGGSTMEAQEAIGAEVSYSLVKFLFNGSTTGAVNFPDIQPPPLATEVHRITNIHVNVPGALRDINVIISEVGCNVRCQYLSTHQKIGYLVIDTDTDLSHITRQQISELPTSIRTRLIK